MEDGQFTHIMKSLKNYVASTGREQMTPDLFQGVPLTNERRPSNEYVRERLVREKIEDLMQEMYLTPAHWCELMGSYYKSYLTTIANQKYSFGYFPGGEIENKEEFLKTYLFSAWNREFARFGMPGKAYTVAEWREAILNSDIVDKFETSRFSQWRVMDSVDPREPRYIGNVENNAGALFGKLLAEHEVKFKSNLKRENWNYEMINMMIRSFQNVKFTKENCLEVFSDYIRYAGALKGNNAKTLDETFEDLANERITMIEGKSNFSPSAIHGSINCAEMIKYLTQYINAPFSYSPKEIRELILNKIPGAKEGYKNAFLSDKTAIYKIEREKLFNNKKETKLIPY